MTTSINRESGRDAALDGLRGVAVLMVFVFHYGGGLKSGSAVVRGLGWVAEAGWTGVVVFFALSGFLITTILWESRGVAGQLKNFYARRALRILPLYYGAIALVAVISLGGGARFSELSGLLYFIPFVQNLPYAVDHAFNGWYTLPVYHLWSIAVEEQFYLVWPVVLLLAKNRERALRWCLWGFLLTVVFRAVVWGPMYSANLSREFGWFTLTHAGAILLGAALALVRLGRRWERVTRFALPAFVGGVAMYLLTGWAVHSLYLTQAQQFTVGMTGATVAAAAAIPLALREGMVRRVLSVSVLAWLGRISFGFYVFHVLLAPLYDVVAAHLVHAGSGMEYQAVRFGVAFVLTVVVAWVSFVMVERPLMRLRSHAATSG